MIDTPSLPFKNGEVYPVVLDKFMNAKTSKEAVDLGADARDVRQTSDSQQSVREFFAKHRDQLMAFIVSRVTNRSDAEDVFQTTFVDAVAGTFQAGTNLRAWVFRIAKNRIVDCYRKTKRQKTTDFAIEPAGPTTEPLEALLRSEEASWLRTCLSLLSDVEQRVVRFRCGGVSHQEIARRESWGEVNRSEKAMNRAKRKLKECLESKQSL